MGGPSRYNLGMVDGFVIAFGLAIGSFLNVCIHRIPRGQSITRPRSSCPHCHHSIRPWENIPVFSYLFLRGKCSQCGKRISWVYPTVEVVTGLTFYLLFLKYGFYPPVFVNMVFFGLLLILTFIDLFERILPNILTLGGAVFGFLVSPFQSGEFFYPFRFLDLPNVMWTHYVDSAIGILVGGGFLWFVAELYFRVRKIEGMGFGDIKMMAMVGAFLGWGYAWLTILMGSLLGAVVGSLFILISRKGRRYELPFGSFLAAGAIASTLWGRQVFSFYLSQF